MSIAEAIARSITCWLALAAIAGYAIDGLGFGVQPWAAIAVALGLTGVAKRVFPGTPTPPRQPTGQRTGQQHRQQGAAQ
jgi:hypothetical protein